MKSESEKLRVLSPSEKIAIYNKLSKGFECTLWKKDQGKTFLFEISSKLDQRFGLGLAPLDDFPKEHHNTTMVLSFNIGNKKYFGSSTLETVANSSHFYFSMGQNFYIKEARGQKRLHIDEELSLDVLINDQIFKGRDVSSGGLSFFADNEWAKNYTAGKHIENCQFILDRYSFNVGSVRIVTNNQVTQKSSPYFKHYRIGVQFGNLTEITSEKLNKLLDELLCDQEFRNVYFRYFVA